MGEEAELTVLQHSLRRRIERHVALLVESTRWLPNKPVRLLPQSNPGVELDEEVEVLLEVDSLEGVERSGVDGGEGRDVGGHESLRHGQEGVKGTEG